MRKAVFMLLLVVIGFVAQAAAAESPKKIIDRYKKASGGNKVSRIKSTLMSGSVKSTDGASGRFLYRASGPDRLRVDIEIGNAKVSECYNGKSAWRLDGRGLRTLLGAEAKRLRLEALIANTRLRDLSRYRIVPQPVVKAAVEGREANAIEMALGDARVKLFFDAASHLLLKQERATADGDQEIFYGDYRAVDGVMEPFSLRMKSAAGELLITMDRVEHNAAPEAAAFLYPQVEGAKPLPDVETLMREMIANQEKIEELREQYTFRETETENKLDGDGRIKESETRVYEVTPVAGEFVRRLVSVNGRPLSAEELEKQDRQAQKEVEEALKRQEKRRKEREQKRERVGGEDADDERSVTILSFLKASEITSVRREVFRGQEVIAFDFEPRKGFKPKSRLENLISKLAGTMWVDETAKQVARLEARLT
ncbi:MAG TPA: hypothetical protein VNO70_01850, partial [Blastocatellia bacterium]|nr:hypothetical protein [Blastocatellia bacterium]